MIKSYKAVFTILFLSFLLSSFLSSAFTKNQQVFNYSTQSKILELTVADASNTKWTFNGTVVSQLGNKIVIEESGVYTVEYLISGQRKQQSVHVDKETGKIVTMYIIGDSTVADYRTYDPDYYNSRYPLIGWGQRFYEYMTKDSVKIVLEFAGIDSLIIDNRARGGQSTKTFMEGGNWAPIYNALNAGDYVLMQFGHNDASTTDPKGVDTTGYKEFLKTFINQTKEKGGIPILITPVARNSPWSGRQLGNIHLNFHKAMKNLAVELDVRLIDLTQRSIDFFTEKGQGYITENYFMNVPAGKYPAYPDGYSDGTHFNEEGAFQVANLVFNGLKDLFHISVTTNNDLAGSVDGQGWHEIEYSPDFIVGAKPNRGFRFVKWTGDVNSESNPLRLDPIKNYTLEAVFEQTAKPQFTIESYVEGDGNIEFGPYGGLYEEGSNVFVNLKSNESSRFHSVFFKSTEHTDSAVTIENINSNMLVYALFLNSNLVVFPVNKSGNTNMDVMTSGDYFTGGSYAQSQVGKTSSIKWGVISSAKDNAELFFRFQNKSKQLAYGAIYLDGKKTFSLPFVPTDTVTHSWKITNRLVRSLNEGYTEIEVRFDSTVASSVNIDMMLISGLAIFTPQAILGLNENAIISKVTLFPNPIKKGDKLSLNIEGSENEKFGISVFDLAGKKHHESTFIKENEASSFSIATDSFAPGIYMIHIETKQGKTVHKFIID
jgi:lysophospholipase L1-like esterase